MIKNSTLLNDSSRTAKRKKGKDFTPDLQAVKMLISYSKALQVINCSEFKTCYVVLN